MPMHVWDTATSPVTPAWSAPVATGRVWVYDAAAWKTVTGIWVSDGAGGWSQFYSSYAAFVPTIRPAGTTSVVGGSTGVGTVNLNLSNRQPQWSVRGTQTLYDFGVQQQQRVLDDVSDGPFIQPQLGVSTTGEVRWIVYYHDTAGGADGPSETFSIFF